VGWGCEKKELLRSLGLTLPQRAWKYTNIATTEIHWEENGERRWNPNFEFFSTWRWGLSGIAQVQGRNLSWNESLSQNMNWETIFSAFHPSELLFARDWVGWEFN
jgi:hypothetical protein